MAPNLALAAVAASALACVSPGEGPEPPSDAMYFPVGLAVSPGGHTLYVANSDFDLQYNGGTVLALDLDRIRASIPPLWDESDPRYPCGGLPANPKPILSPGACGPIDLRAPPVGGGPLVLASTQIGAFAADVVLATRPDRSGARLFLPVRGDPSLTWIDVDDDRHAPPAGARLLSCGQSEASKRCDAVHRAGEDPKTNLRGAVMPPEPYGVAVAEDSVAVVVTHQTTGALSLVTNAWDAVPALQFVATGFPYGAIGVAAVPIPRYVGVKQLDYQPGFLVTFRAAAQVNLVRYYDDEAASPARPFISSASAVGITVSSSGVDSRGIAIDADDRRACEAGCLDEEACLQDCANVPMRVFIANRAPPALLVGETRTAVSPTGSDDQIAIFDSVPLTFGPSRVAVGKIVDAQGKARTRAFVTCFDSRLVFVYDPAGGRVDAEVRTGRGPHALAFDPVQPLLYVVHFTDSYIGVVDLDQRHTATYGTMVASVGVPLPPREAK
jgi:DNA-binding beta-propeller fold protein YncE